MKEAGGFPFWREEWNTDTRESIEAESTAYKDSIDVKLLKAIGEAIVDIATGKRQAIEIGMKDNMLSEFYEKALGWPTSTQQLARTVKQIIHRHPHMNILEIGAGTGGATKGIFQQVNNTFASYTFTDISSGFFDTARETLNGPSDRMVFKVLDISKDPLEQGFKEHSYDLVVASMVLHATVSIRETLQNARRLLKPGGYLVVFEGHNTSVARLGALFRAFPGWWVGAGEGRVLSPFLGMPEWDEVLRETGFSGCDTATPDFNSLVKPFTIFASQAIDERVSLLREPLSSSARTPPSERAISDLVLLGGNTLRTSQLVSQLKNLLRPFCISIKTARTLLDLSSLDMSRSTTVLSLTELDESLFKTLTDTKWESTKTMLLRASSILWVTQGRRGITLTPT